MDSTWYMMILRLFLAALFGGIIGFERENPNRPAGFRTHILVCVASALIMLTSEYVFLRFEGRTGMDPTRLGAQVISGIGFLGAGTIIKDKFKVRGLTTAASLWSVACIGLAVGGGYYIGAAAATIIIFITLMALKKMEKKMTGRTAARAFYITVDNKNQLLESVLKVLGSYGVSIEAIDFIRNNSGKTVLIKVLYNSRYKDMDQPKLVSDLYAIEGIRKVSHD